MMSPFRRPFRLAFLAALCAAVFVFGSFTRAAENGFPIYFESSKLILKDVPINRTTYLPLIDIINYLKLPYTDAIALGSRGIVRKPRGVHVSAAPGHGESRTMSW